jgi:hypothetical protein
MKNLSLTRAKLTREQMRSINGGNTIKEFDAGGSPVCKCVMENGSTSHQVANCDQCFDFCPTLSGTLVSTWCFG